MNDEIKSKIENEEAPEEGVQSTELPEQHEQHEHDEVDVFSPSQLMAAEAAAEATAGNTDEAVLEADVVEESLEATSEETVEATAADEEPVEAVAEESDTPSALESLEQEGNDTFVEGADVPAPMEQQLLADDDADVPTAAVSTAPHFVLPKPSDLTAQDLVPILEAVLFAADRPVSIDRMRGVVAPKPDEDPGPEKPLFHQALESIKARCEQLDTGFELREAHGGFHFVSRAPFAEYIRRYQASKPFRLGRAALETLSIIAYKEPITRAEIDQVRGMDSSHLMRTLIERGLVRMAGKAEVPGRPVLYATTPRFLEVMGLNSLADLPPLSELKQLEGDVDDPMRRMEQGLDRFMQPDPHAVSALQPQNENGETIFDQGLSEIDALIQTAGKPQEEVFASRLHQEVALANQEALEAFQASTPRRRKRTVTYDELVGGEAAPAEGVVATDALATEAAPATPNELGEPTADLPDTSTPEGNA